MPREGAPGGGVGKGNSVWWGGVVWGGSGRWVKGSHQEEWQSDSLVMFRMVPARTVMNASVCS